MTAFVFYDLFKASTVNGVGAVNFSSDTIKVALVTSSYTPANTDQYWTVPSAFEVSGSGYTAGGLTTTATISGSTTTTTKVVLSNVTWSQATGGVTNAFYIIIYKSAGSAATSPLIGYYSITTNVGNVAGDLVVTFDSTNGAFTIS